MNTILKNILVANEYLINNQVSLIFVNISMFIAIILTTLSTYKKDESNEEKHPYC